MEANKGSILITVLGGIEVALIGLVGYFLSRLVGNTDTSNDLVKTVIPITGTIMGIVLVHTGIWFFYLTHNPLSANLYFLMATSMSLIVSLTALSLALVNRS